MNQRTIPVLTIALVLLVMGVHFLLPDRALLYFSAEQISQGQFWRLLTGHFVHADLQHLVWNCLGLAVLGALIEQHSRVDWWAALFVGIASVNVLLVSPFSQLDYYCGLSGVLNTLLLIALWLEWRLSHSWLVLAIAIGSVAKAVVEVYLGESLVTHISWPPYAWSHVAGLAGGLVLICWQKNCGLLLNSGNE